VYRAIDERLRRSVALKVLPDEAMRDEGRWRRFMREARSAAAVVHSNVAAVHEVDESGGHVYIAMELVEGISLRQELARVRLGLPECIRIAKGIARALAKAHEKGIVHRDLKPDNVMLNEDREVKVLDFGLAKLLDVEETKGLWGNDGLDETASHDTAGRLMGTPAYMSPEQATGKPIDAHSDVFSFGVILYEMLTGKRPFGGTSAMETLVAVARDEPPPASSIAALPAAIELILVTCMQKNPELRFASGRELAAALDAFDAAQHSGSDLGSLPTLLAANLPSIEVITNASTMKSGDPRAKRKMGPLVAIVTVVVAAIAWVAWHRGRDHASDVPTNGASAAYAPKPDAATLFAQAEREEREGRHDLACPDDVRASDADPSFARAAIRAAMCNAEDPRTGRTYFRRAWAARATLAPNELAFLDAEEPRPPASRRFEVSRRRAPPLRRLVGPVFARHLSGSPGGDRDVAAPGSEPAVRPRDPLRPRRLQRRLRARAGGDRSVPPVDPRRAGVPRRASLGGRRDGEMRGDGVGRAADARGRPHVRRRDCAARQRARCGRDRDRERARVAAAKARYADGRGARGGRASRRDSDRFAHR